MKIIVFVLFVIWFLYSMYELFKSLKAIKKLEYKIEHAKCLNDYANILYEDE